MTSVVKRLSKLGLASPPKWLPDNVLYETMMGSVAYGVSSDMSDVDIYGFCLPPKEDVFPHLRGEIPGFGTQKNRFDQYQQHHVESNGRTYDMQIYSIVKYFQLAMENNPNMIDSLFTPINCVLHMSRIGLMVRDARKMFLHKGYFHKARGFAYSQLSKMDRDTAEGKRKDIIDKYGYDTKFAYHIVRLLDQTEQVLLTGDINLQRSKEVLKAVRAGMWTKEKVHEYFAEREKYLHGLYEKSTNVPHSPPEFQIKNLLMTCLEEQYGSLSNAVTLPGRERYALEEIAAIVNRTLYDRDVKS